MLHLGAVVLEYPVAADALYWIELDVGVPKPIAHTGSPDEDALLGGPAAQALALDLPYLEADQPRPPVAPKFAVEHILDARTTLQRKDLPSNLDGPVLREAAVGLAASGSDSGSRNHCNESCAG